MAPILSFSYGGHHFYVVFFETMNPRKARLYASLHACMFRQPEIFIAWELESLLWLCDLR